MDLINISGNTFSLFELEKTLFTNNVGNTYITRYIFRLTLKISFLEIYIGIKTCNVEPFFYVIKSMLLTREQKKNFLIGSKSPSSNGFLVINPELPTLAK